eukprot:s705_g6.t1
MNREYLVSLTMNSLIPATAITIINVLLMVAARWFGEREVHLTKTGEAAAINYYMTVAMILNAAVILWNISLRPPDWFVAGGLVNDMYAMLALNFIFPPLMFLMDPPVLLLRQALRLLDLDSFWKFCSEVGSVASSYCWVKETKLTKSPTPKVLHVLPLHGTSLCTELIYAPLMPLAPLIGLVSLLFQYGNDKWMLLRYCRRPAIAHNAEAAIQALMRTHGAQPVAKMQGFGCEQLPISSVQELLTAVAKQDLGQLEGVLAQGQEPYMMFPARFTFLRGLSTVTAASRMGNLEMLRLLQAAGADLGLLDAAWLQKAQSRSCGSAWAACWFYRTAEEAHALAFAWAVSYTLAYNFNALAFGHSLPISTYNHRACRSMFENERGRSGLHEAAARGKDRTLPLEMSRCRSCESFLQVERQDRVDPSQSDKDGGTALHMASATGELRVVQLLLASGGQVEDEHFRSCSVNPLRAAVTKGVVPLAQALLGAAADVNQSDCGGNTSLLRQTVAVGRIQLFGIFRFWAVRLGLEVSDE